MYFTTSTPFRRPALMACICGQGMRMRVAFNQDASCVVCGTTRGFRVYNCSPFGRFYSSNDVESGLQGVGVAEMFYSTSLVVVSGRPENTLENTSPRQLAVVNTKKSGSHAVVCELTFPTPVLAVRLNQRRLCVALEAQVYLYDISNMKLLHVIDGSQRDVVDTARSGNNWLAYASAGKKVVLPAATDTEPVEAAEAAEADVSDSGTDLEVLSDLKPQDSASSVASVDASASTSNASAANASANASSGGSGPGAPGASGNGTVVIFNMDTLTPAAVINAHKSPVASLALNEDGSLLATCSNKGTLVRVFAVPSGTLLYEFRRGSYSSHVYSLAFSLGSRYLCVSSSTQTVHVYKLESSQPDKTQNKKERWFGSAKASRDFAYFKLPLKHGVRTTLAVAPLSNTVYTASETGKLFCHQIEDNGGECKCIGEYVLN